jgi:hypothetical protein
MHCQKLFVRRYNRDLHVRRIHEKNRPFSCRSCALSFVLENELYKHEHRIHGIENPKDDGSVTTVNVFLAKR